MELKPILSPFTKMLFFAQRYTVSVALILILLLGAGTSVAAKEALPGDLLYPIKIHLNENVESILAITPKATAEVNAKQATRRIVEAETLANKGELTPEKNTEIKDRFSEKIDSIDKSFKEMEKEGDSESISEVNNKFEKDLDRHFKTFIDVSVSSSSENSLSTTTLSDIIRRVRNKHHDNENRMSSTTLNIEQIKSRDQKENKNKNENKIETKRNHGADYDKNNKFNENSN